MSYQDLPTPFGTSVEVHPALSLCPSPLMLEIGRRSLLWRTRALRSDDERRDMGGAVSRHPRPWQMASPRRDS